MVLVGARTHGAWGMGYGVWGMVLAADAARSGEWRTGRIDWLGDVLVSNQTGSQSDECEGEGENKGYQG